MAHAVPESGHRLAAENAPGGIGHGAADDEWEALARLLEKLINCEQGGFGVQGVKNGLDQQHVGPAFHQRLNLLKVSRPQFLKIHIACAGVVHIGADAGSFGRGAQGPHHVAGMVWRGELVCRRAGDAGRGHVHLVGQIGHVVVRHGHRGGPESVGFDQVCTGGQVFFVDVADHVRPGQRQQLVVALYVPMEVFETVSLAIRPAVTRATVLRFGQFEALHHGAHRAVQDDDAFLQKGGQGLSTGVGDRLSKGFHMILIVETCRSPRTPEGCICRVFPGQ